MKNKLIKGTPEWEAYWRPIIEKRKKTCIEKYGYFTSFSNAEIQQKIKNVMIEKYGVDNIFKSPERQKELLQHKLEKNNYNLSNITLKIKNTVQEKYGVDNISQLYEIKQKKKETVLERFGTDNVFKSDEIKDKIKQTVLQKYGVEHISQSIIIQQRKKQNNLSKYGYEFTPQVPEIREKMEATLIKNGGIGNAREQTKSKYLQTSLFKYGFEYATQSNEIKEKIKNTCLQKYGVNWYCLSKACKLKGNNSKPNQSFENLLINNNIKYEREFYLDGLSYDFKVNDYLIEINPWWTHNSSIKNQWGNCKDINYHLNKSKVAWKNNYKCIHIFDWINKDLVLNHIKDNTLYLSDFRNIKCFRYNVKTKQCQEGNIRKDNEVLIYDGGQDLLW